MADERAEISCETQGHFWGPGGKCVFCETPKPVETIIPSNPAGQRYVAQFRSGNVGRTADSYRITDVTTDSRVATCYHRDNARLVTDALNTFEEVRQCVVSAAEVDAREGYADPEPADGWQPIETANVNQLFASSTWVLIQRDDGFVTEAMPHYFSAGGYIWMTARGDNCRGSPDEHSGMLRHDVTHWRPLPSPLKTSAPQSVAAVETSETRRFAPGECNCRAEAKEAAPRACPIHGTSHLSAARSRFCVGSYGEPRIPLPYGGSYQSSGYPVIRHYAGAEKGSAIAWFMFEDEACAYAEYRNEQPPDGPFFIARDEILRLQTQNTNLLNTVAAKEAKIDALMLEYCPGEMSAEQRENWAKHQRAVEECPE